MRVPGDPGFAVDEELDPENEGILEQGRAYRGDGSVRDPRVPASEAKPGSEDPERTERRPGRKEGA